jgi:succinate dehydrogenase / fumarate reductase iron-sulfur subunit
MANQRSLILRIKRGRPGSTSTFPEFSVDVPEAAYVIDAVEKVWKEQDPTLLFRHACHHASCGSCGVRIDGRERLMCITPVANLNQGKPITLEPLRNFPWIGDLVVEVAGFFEAMHQASMPMIRVQALGERQTTRFENCIECGLCMSACPITAVDPRYLGPAALAAAERVVTEPRGQDANRVLDLALGPHGVWRCRNAFECTEACPQDVDPAGAIGRLRRLAIWMALGRDG